MATGKLVMDADRLGAALNATLVQLAPEMANRFAVSFEELTAIMARALVANAAACAAASLGKPETASKAAELANELNVVIQAWIDRQ